MKTEIIAPRSVDRIVRFIFKGQDRGFIALLVPFNNPAIAIDERTALIERQVEKLVLGISNLAVEQDADAGAIVNAALEVAARLWAGGRVMRADVDQELIDSAQETGRQWAQRAVECVECIAPGNSPTRSS